MVAGALYLGRATRPMPDDGASGYRNGGNSMEEAAREEVDLVLSTNIFQSSIYVYSRTAYIATAIQDLSPYGRSRLTKPRVEAENMLAR